MDRIELPSSLNETSARISRGIVFIIFVFIISSTIPILREPLSRYSPQTQYRCVLNISTITVTHYLAIY